MGLSTAASEATAYYGMYAGVRNATWQLLLRVDIAALPVRCEEVAAGMGIPVLHYARAGPLLRALGLQGHCENNDGFAAHIDGRWCVFLNGDAAALNRNFTLAHELGHIFLGHVMEETQAHGGERVRYTRLNRREWACGLDRTDAMEREANMFAARMLSPACALWGLDLRKSGEIARVCGLPVHVAQKRAERMRVLYARNLFLKSPAEGMLFRRLKPYLLSQRPEGRLPEHCLRKLEEIVTAKSH